MTCHNPYCRPCAEKRTIQAQNRLTVILLLILSVSLYSLWRIVA